MSPPTYQRVLPGLEPEDDLDFPLQPTPLDGHLVVEEAATAPPAEAVGRTVYAVDAHSLIFQVFHALPEMTSPRGEPVGAVFGFVRDVLFLLEQKKPDYLFCAFDMPGPTFRSEIYEQYKATRGEMPDDLPSQIEKIQRVLEVLGVPVLGYEGYEADDILATLAQICDQWKIRCHIVTGDKDCRQLISDMVSVYNVRKDQDFDAQALQEEWGIRPDQVVDFQALVGDAVDNVPGVPLIGPKLARELLQQFDTLDVVLDRAEEVKGAKRRQNLLEHRQQALVSRELVRLERNLPLALDWAAARVGNFNLTKAAELFAEFGFRAFGQKVAALAPEPPAQPWQADYQLVETPQELAELIERLKAQRCISVDLETTHLWPRWAEIVGYAFAWEESRAYYVPVRAPAGEPSLDPAETLAALRTVLTDPAIEKIGQNLKYDMIVLRNVGIELAGVAFDSMVASYLLDAGERNHTLDELSRRYLNHTPIPIRDLIGTGKDQKRMDEVPVAQVSDYAGEDADIPLRLRPILLDRLREAELESLFDDVEIPLVEVLVEMETRGIRVDLERLSTLSTQYGQRLEALEAEIYALAGHPLNLASPKQLAQVLFEELKLPVVKKSKSGPSTNADVLEQLAPFHPLPAKIIDHRQYAKLKNTYVDALPAMVHPQTGRVHASFNQVVTATGRLSSSDPNLQNIPVRTEAGREIRSAFLPEQGWKLLAADYSQIELRVLAHFSRDETLCAAFANDEDIHARVASEVFGVPLEGVTGEMRRTAKGVNFGILYGQSPFGLAAALGIAQDEAGQFIDAYFRRYPGVGEFLAKTLDACRESGYVRTILGRRRAIRGIRAGAGLQRNLPERTAINTVIQGSAADLIKLAMIRIHRRLRNEGRAARLLLQIHDELIFEVPPSELADLGTLVAEEMAHVLEIAVPLKVDLKVGDHWADCEPW